MVSETPIVRRNRKKTAWLAAFRAFINRHRITSLVVAGGILLVVGGGMAYSLYMATPDPIMEVIPPVIKKEEPKYYSNLTGKLVKDEAATNQAVTAIMIENSPDARPQSGLKQAGVVYEAIAEGGITRFLALYQEDKPGLVGPVRSVRLYYVDWLTPYNASVAHVGGSAKALKLVRNGSYRDIDQFFNAGTYWRATDRYAPHNVYTNFKNLDALNKSKGYKTSKFTGFPRVDGNPVEAPNAKTITVTMSSALYNSSYTYNAKKNTYTRSQGGATHTDREKGAITPSVVIVMKSPMAHVFEDGYRESYQTTGTGEAHIFQNGTVAKATWSKKSRTAQLQFLDKNGKQIELIRGQTWISVVPTSGGGVSWE